MSKMINVALASYGMSGRIFHAPFLKTHPRFNLALILERSKNDSSVHYPQATIVRNYDDILSDKSIDLVVVNTPNLLHYSMAKAALAAGKHVVVEKPFTTTVAEARELVALAEEKKLMLSVYHNRRLQSGHKTAQKLLVGKTLGALKTFEVSIDRYRPQPGPKKWKEESNPGAGLLYDLGSHLIDEALVLFGLPQAVCADLRVERDGSEVCDYFHIRFDYPDFKVILKATMLAREPGPAYVIHGDKGSYIKYGHDVQEERLANGVWPDKQRWAEENERDWGILHNDNGKHRYPTVTGSYEDYYENIYRHLTAAEPLLVTPNQALRVIAIIDQVRLSAAEQRCIILPHLLR